jgi:aminoglycoside 3-N-acetyltransferase
MLPVTFDNVLTAFRTLGLKEGDTIELHGSLKAVGLVSGGPNTIIDALLKVLSREGTLIMAAQYTTNTEPALWEHPPVDIEAFEAIRATHPPYKGRESYLRWMGSLAEVLQLKEQTLFSDHPNLAVMALGKQAKWLTMDQPLTPAFGLGSPFEKALQLKSKALLIGVGYDVLTGLHVAEALSGKRPYHLESATILSSGHPKRIKLLDYDYDSELFTQIGLAYEKTHSIETVLLGNATVKLIDMVSIHDFALAYCKEHL